MTANLSRAAGMSYRAFPSLCESLAALRCEAILDGEIVILDESGHPRFYDLMRKRGEPVFYAFDCPFLDGNDLRQLPLLQRKERLQRLVQNNPRILFADHIESAGSGLFRLVCDQDLEGIMAKRKDAAYGQDWFKIRNPDYTQYEGRRELFDQRRVRKPATPSAGPS